MSILLPGGLHCEAVLATLGKYYKDGLDEPDNIALSTCKVLLITYYCLLNLTFYFKTLLYSGGISVSKLCCPLNSKASLGAIQPQEQLPSGQYLSSFCETIVSAYPCGFVAKNEGHPEGIVLIRPL